MKTALTLLGIVGFNVLFYLVLIVIVLVYEERKFGTKRGADNKISDR